MNATPSQSGDAAIRARMPARSFAKASVCSAKSGNDPDIPVGWDCHPFRMSKYCDMAYAVPGAEAPSRQSDDWNAHPQRFQVVNPPE